MYTCVCMCVHLRLRRAVSGLNLHQAVGLTASLHIVGVTERDGGVEREYIILLIQSS